MGRKNYRTKPEKYQPFRLSPQSICQSKKAYNSQFEAEQSADYQSRLNPVLKFKTYYCPDCQKWHLTTKEYS